MIAFNPKYIHDGREYMKLWPMKKELYTLFPECRIISATRFGIKVMPPVAVFTLVIQVQTLGMEFFPQALAFCIFFLSLPVQGLYWLGSRANQQLPPEIKGWYQDIYAKMQNQGCALERLPRKPRFKELAKLLNTAFSQLDKAFTSRLF